MHLRDLKATAGTDRHLHWALAAASAAAAFAPAAFKMMSTAHVYGPPLFWTYTTIVAITLTYALVTVLASRAAAAWIGRRMVWRCFAAVVLAFSLGHLSFTATVWIVSASHDAQGVPFDIWATALGFNGRWLSFGVFATALVSHLVPFDPRPAQME